MSRMCLELQESEPPQSWLNATGHTAGQKQSYGPTGHDPAAWCGHSSLKHVRTQHSKAFECSPLSTGATYSKTMLTLEPYLYLKVKAHLMSQQLKTLALS